MSRVTLPSSSCVALPVTVSPHPAPCFFLGLCMLGSCCQTRAYFQGITTFAMLLYDISGVLSLLVFFSCGQKVIQSCGLLPGLFDQSDFCRRQIRQMDPVLSLWDLLAICVGDVGPRHGKAPSFPTPALPHHEDPDQLNLSGDALALLLQAPLMAPSLVGGRQRRSGRLSGSKQTASSCSCSRKPSKKPSTSPSKPTPSVSTTPLSSPSRISSLGLMTPPRSPVSPLSPLLVNKSGTHWWHLHLLPAGLSPEGH